MPRVTVSFHGAYAQFAGSRRAEVDASSVGDALARVVERFPSLRERLRDEHGRLRQHVNVFANAEEMRHLEGESTPLRDGDEVHIIPAVSGGR